MFKLTVIPQPCKLQAFEGFEILGGGIPISKRMYTRVRAFSIFFTCFCLPFCYKFFPLKVKKKINFSEHKEILMIHTSICLTNEDWSSNKRNGHDIRTNIQRDGSAAKPQQRKPRSTLLSQNGWISFSRKENRYDKVLIANIKVA